MKRSEKETIYDMVLRFVGDDPIWLSEITEKISLYRRKKQNKESVARALCKARDEGLIHKSGSYRHCMGRGWVVKP